MTDSDPTTAPAPETVVEPTPVPAAPAPEAVKSAPSSPSEAVSPPTPPAAPAPEPQPVPEVPKSPQHFELSRIAQDIQIRRAQVETVLAMLDAGVSVPYIARHKRADTGGLPEEPIRRIQERVRAVRGFAERKQTILKSLAQQAKLTDDLTNAIINADHPKRLEDLYLPFKPKKKSVAQDAKEKGLEPLATAIWNSDEAVAKLDEVLPGMVDEWKQLHDVDAIRAGARAILAEMIADRADVRGSLRVFIWDTAGLITKKVETLPEGKGKEHHEFFDWNAPVAQIPPHHAQAINRAEREQAVRVHFEWDETKAVEIIAQCLNLGEHAHKDLLLIAAKDAVEKSLKPSLEREIRRDLTERAQEHALGIFARNLRGLLMQPPVRGKRVLAIDPGLRTGCKLVALDEHGAVLEDAVVYPHMPKREVETAKRKIEQFLRKHQLNVIAIGNGTACRETEHLVSDIIADLANRKLSPAAGIVTDAPVTSDSPAPAAEAPVETPPEEPKADAPPEAASVLTADVPAPVVESHTTSMEISSPLGMMESSMPVMTSVLLEGSIHTSGSTATADTIAAQVVMTAAEPASTAAASPPPPTIDLSGLPDAPDGIVYAIVNEAGSSEYGASALGREELPNLSPEGRAAVSIGRRLQDPLAELVKIDPQHLGSGIHQHDLRPKFMKETLDAVVESSVNHIGVDLNTASAALLKHVAGLNSLAARDIVTYRTANGPFKTLEALKAVPNLGDTRFAQASGFLKVSDGDDALDRTWIHPEHYSLARTILAELGFGPKELADKARHDAIRSKFNTVDIEAMAKKLDVHPALIDELFMLLARPGRDPREDLPPLLLKSGVMKIEELQPGMELKGTVQNVVPFGAFVDVGVKESGLIHISQLANRYIKSPHDLVSVGDVVTVWVMEVKPAEKKISLTMIPPRRERPPQEMRPEMPPQERRPDGPRFDGPRPPRGEGRPEGQGENRGAPRGEFRGGDRPPRPDGPGGGGRMPQRRSFDRRGPRDNAPQEPIEMPPPKPRKPAGPVKLTDEKKSGKSALNTFGELSAFFKTKTGDADAPAPATPPPPETPPPPAE